VPFSVLRAPLIRRSLSTTAINGYSNKVHSEDPKWLPVDPSFATTAIHAGFSPKEDKHGFVVQSISVATTSEQDAPGLHRGYDYTRCGNPTRAALEKTLAALDKGKYGFAFSSGVAAVCNIMSLLQKGDGVILTDSIYSGTGVLFERYATKFGISSEFIDLYSENNALERTLKPNTKLVWLETPTNPMLNIIDIAKTVETIKNYSKDIIVVVDNTFLTSYYQRPLTLGADLSMYSLTKFANGHSDVLMGAVVTNRDDLRERLNAIQTDMGAVPSPFDCFLVQRSLKTLHVRMPLHMTNALSAARFLETHPKVERVLHPGLESHPQHAIALKQSSGNSGLFSFYVKDKSAHEFLKRLKIFKLATSLGGTESLASTPYHMSHSGVAPEVKAKVGITENFVRLTVGLESMQDIIEDLDQALRY
jgi:cystathionine gamma-lyase